MKGIVRSLFIVGVVSLCFLWAASRASAQLVVDCSGQTPWAYSSLNSAVADSGNDSYILVYPGTCNDSVGIYNKRNIQIGALWGTRVSLQGGFNIYQSDDIYLYGFDVQSSYGDGINVNSSRNVTLDYCTSSHNAGNGVNAIQDSYVYIGGSGDFSGNGNIGISVQDNSTLVMGWGGWYTFDNNGAFGIEVTQSRFSIWGNTELANNRGGPYYGGNGIHLNGGSSGRLFALNGDNRIFGNQSAGISVDNHSSLEIMGGEFLGNSFQNYIDGNGPTGIVVQSASQVSLVAIGYITNHSGAGVDAEGNSQVNMSGDNNFIQNNHGPGFNIHANSEADLWGGTITGNDVGVVTSSNSSVAVTATLSSNAHGPIQCDSSSYLSITNLTPSMLGPANGCKITGGPGVSPSHTQTQRYSVPDWKPQKDAEDNFRKLASQYHK
jgi:hypothetical protein